MKNLTRIVVLAVAMGLASASQLSSSTALTRRTRQSFNLREIEIQLERQGCPAPLRACPILRSDISLDLNVALPKRTISKRNWECFNLQTDVNSCGSCDNDCMEIPNVARAKCDSGSCKIVSCRSGLQPKATVNHVTGSKSMKCA
ncbi:uncharacterized protein PGTG_16651 [Puccinia graminis f. sp. tritici CRL 75-36-700-3]|uniref:Protein CPL1-like domain-containing protein n=1 Tax=Puccinia graminis f. sp. tritici (strain CRL 75-36-700-3 / race SCCL) TaxID=418459 RepID=E3L250_PUCGT|nr:uncharacterized protein PGTG_16651 [Puccinia graminis f. sp. tritici CRL 75-36-700-3]EFP90625.1 hypothetical protein PGTG_16651 [Puccinia graminis f. sp. tritici CRL 75-36-700-3]